MNPQFLVTKQNLAKPYRKRTLSQQVRIGAFSLLVMIIVMIGFMGVFFLMRFNSVSTKGYVLNQLERERMQQVKEIQRREMEIAEARTLEHILASEKVQSMVRINEEKISYLGAESSVARK